MLYVKYEKIGLTASEEMSFENVDRRTDDRWTTDDCSSLITEKDHLKFLNIWRLCVFVCSLMAV